MSYTTRIIQYMREKGNKGMTAGECRDKLGTTEFRKRVSELRRAGYKIESRWEEGPNSNGTTSRYCRYFLIKEPEKDALTNKIACITKALDKKLDKEFDPLYHYDYMRMLEDLRTIRKGETKKNDL